MSDTLTYKAFELLFSKHIMIYGDGHLKQMHIMDGKCVIEGRVVGSPCLISRGKHRYVVIILILTIIYTKYNNIYTLFSGKKLSLCRKID